MTEKYGQRRKDAALIVVESGVSEGNNFHTQDIARSGVRWSGSGLTGRRGQAARLVIGEFGERYCAAGTNGHIIYNERLEVKG
jgi:hypothetical protein